MKVPSFMLKKLYVSDSLEAAGDGFQFKLKNTLATATIVEPPEIFVDGEAVAQEDITFVVGDEEIKGADVTDEDTFKLEKGIESAVRADGPSLDAGAHKLRIKVATKEWDTLDFEVEDSI